MELHSLKPAAGSVKKRKRIARGQGSGHGGTATRGHKGDGSRSGHYTKRNFEGGQIPLQMRLPKVGFKNINGIEYVVLNLDRLVHIADSFQTTSVDFPLLLKAGIVRRTDVVKILGGGELTKSLSVSVHACSESAKAAIEKAGGTINIVK
ncbi:MAG: 50S ribosomal protein L15 [Saprospiraceae bacterium]|jgi:large subunit ribosomal protein L15